ncbi:MAG: acylphosphatase, partial [Planctomycetales bacterium]|nr:acylphosphatase [Planctomycetales bacterium]
MTPVRMRLTVRGVVQGVGFRPFVYGLATRLALTGFVGNDSAGVFIEVEGSPAAVAAFQVALGDEAPPLAHIETVTATPMPAQGDAAFVIVASAAQPAAATLISPDLCTCDDCLRELFDPADRRY